MRQQVTRACIALLVLSCLWLMGGRPVFAVPPAPVPWMRGKMPPATEGVGNFRLHNSRAPLTSRGMRLLGARVPTAGPVKLVAIPVSFTADTDANTSGKGTFPYNTWGPASTANYLRTQLDQVSAYYSEISHGAVTLTCTLAAEAKLDDTMAHYAADQFSGDIDRITRLPRDVVAKVDGTVNFSQFDIVMLIHAGAGQEISGLSGDFWSMHWTLTAGGIPTADGVAIMSWSIMPETECCDTVFIAANPGIDIIAYEADHASFPGAIEPQWWSPLGVWVHELGHAFGMPDVYDVDYNGGVSLGPWSVMASGAYLPEPTAATLLAPNDPRLPPFGSRPCHPDAWNKQLMNWAEIVNVTGRRRHQLIKSTNQTDAKIYRLWRGGRTGTPEYFLVEARGQVGFDRYLPEAGLMVYHIDDNVGSLAANDLQISPTRPRILPLSADNLLEEVVTPGQRWREPQVNTAFPGMLGFTHIGNNSTPSTRDYAGNTTNVDIKNIEVEAPNVYADLSVTSSSITFLAPAPNAILYVNKPLVKAIASELDPASVQVLLNGSPVPPEQVTYDAASGLLECRLGPLTIGTYQVTVSGLDAVDASPQTESTAFSIQEKVLSSGMQMISLPVIGVGTALQVFAAINQPQLAWWNPAQHSGAGGYLQYPATEVELTTNLGTAVDRVTGAAAPPAGKGFWFNLPDNVTCPLRLSGDQTMDDHPYMIALHKGFNMIGNPYSYPIDFSSLVVEYNGRSYGMLEAAQRRLIDPAIYTWTGSQYSIALLPYGRLDPWVGYWFHVRAETRATPLWLIYQPLAAISSSAPAATRARGSEELWSIRVQAAQLLGRRQAEVVLGVARGATGGVDAGLDVAAPPQAPHGIALRAGTPGGRASLMYDYRSTADAQRGWEIAVSGSPGDAILLTWPDLTQLPRGQALLLTDTVTGAQSYLRTAENYLLTLGPQESERLLRLELVSRAAQTLCIRNFSAAPSRSTGRVQMTCQVSVPATVTMEIRTATGRLVARLSRPGRAAGSVSLVWDGCDQQQRRMAHGMYQCQVKAITATGQSTKAVTLFSL